MRSRAKAGIVFQDCFVGLAPSTVIPRESGESSTPRPLGSAAIVSGILDRPVKPGEDHRGLDAQLCLRIASKTAAAASPQTP